MRNCFDPWIQWRSNCQYVAYTTHWRPRGCKESGSKRPNCRPIPILLPSSSLNLFRRVRTYGCCFSRGLKIVWERISWRRVCTRREIRPFWRLVYWLWAPSLALYDRWNVREQIYSPMNSPFESGGCDSEAIFSFQPVFDVWPTVIRAHEGHFSSFSMVSVRGVLSSWPWEACLSFVGALGWMILLRPKPNWETIDVVV